MKVNKTTQELLEEQASYLHRWLIQMHYRSLQDQNEKAAKTTALLITQMSKHWSKQ